MKATKCNKWYLSVVSVLVMALMLSFSISADALQITIDDLALGGVGVVELTIEDGDDGAVDGICSFVGPIPGSTFTLIVSVALSKPAQGSVSNPQMHLNELQLSGGAGTVVISASDQGFGPFATGLKDWNVAGGGYAAGFTEIDVYFDEGDVLHGGNYITPTLTNTQIADLGPFSGGDFSFDLHTGPTPSLNPFSLTIVSTVTHTSGDTSSCDTDVMPTPEPGTIFLIGIGLLGLGIINRKKLGVKA